VAVVAAVTLTLVGDGRVVQGGGQVMKNVAGYDLTRLQTGAFGAFGVVVLVHLRLRALPRADRTFVLEGSRDDLTGVADELRAAPLTPGAIELMSPALARRERWALAIRLVGSVPLVEGEEAVLRGAAAGRFAPLESDDAQALWQRAAEGLTTRALTLRVGGLPEGADELLDLLAHQLGDDWVSASPGVGTIRWSGDATPDRLRHLRRALAAREVPLTLERAPWELRRAVGHFGAYREGVGPLVAGLRHTFDPGTRIVVALEGETHGG
jgi:glycolate oxidase FAD binding subunit